MCLNTIYVNGIFFGLSSCILISKFADPIKSCSYFLVRHLAIFMSTVVTLVSSCSFEQVIMHQYLLQENLFHHACLKVITHCTLLADWPEC